MLNISGIHEGYVLDHIKAGMSLEIYHNLKLDELDDCMVAMITNAKSKKMGRKDIIKVSGDPNQIDLDVVGFFQHHITCNIIRDGKLVEKKTLHHPKKLVNIIKCTFWYCIISYIAISIFYCMAY